MIEVVGAHRVWVEIDAPQVDDPQQLCGVAHHDLASRSPGRELQLDRLDPVGVLLWGALLEERLLLDAVDVAVEYDRPARDPPQRAIGDGCIVANQVELGVARLRKEHLVGVGDDDLAAGGLDDGLLRFRHGGSVPKFARAGKWCAAVTPSGAGAPGSSRAPARRTGPASDHEAGPSTADPRASPGAEHRGAASRACETGARRACAPGASPRGCRRSALSPPTARGRVVSPPGDAIGRAPWTPTSPPTRATRGSRRSYRRPARANPVATRARRPTWPAPPARHR